MGVTKDRDALRLQRMGQSGGPPHVGNGLLGQAVHQIDIDAVDPELVQHVGRGLDRVEGLDSAGGLLHMRAEVLHAEARAIDADVAQRLQQRPRDIARIQFDRVFADRREIETVGELVGDEFEQIVVEDRGRSAAPMYMSDFTSAGMAGDERDLFDKTLRVGLDRLVSQRRLGMAAAVVAKLPAKGNVQV